MPAAAEVGLGVGIEAGGVVAGGSEADGGLSSAEAEGGEGVVAEPEVCGTDKEEPPLVVL
jgi:hypothetical protein